MNAQLLKVWSLAKNVPAVVYIVIAVVGTTMGLFQLNNAYQRAQGALTEQLKRVKFVSDSTAKALTVKNAGLDSLVTVFAAKVASNQAAKHASDVQAFHLKTARDSLAQAITDSLATIGELRARASRMVAASDSAEAAHLKERQTADSALNAARTATIFAVDSVRATAAAALAAAIGRANAAERITQSRTTGLRAALLARCGFGGGSGVVWSGGRALAGPTVTLGCRVLP